MNEARSPRARAFALLKPRYSELLPYLNPFLLKPSLLLQEEIVWANFPSSRGRVLSAELPQLTGECHHLGLELENPVLLHLLCLPPTEHTLKGTQSRTCAIASRFRVKEGQPLSISSFHSKRFSLTSCPLQGKWMTSTRSPAVD